MVRAYERFSGGLVFPVMLPLQITKSMKGSHGLLGNSGHAFHLVLHRRMKTRTSCMPELWPTGSPQPFIPFLAPASLEPFYSNTMPKLSGPDDQVPDPYPTLMCRGPGATLGSGDLGVQALTNVSDLWLRRSGR